MQARVTTVQAVLLSERITGKGAVEQLEISATGVPLWEIEPVLGIVVLVLCIAALWPSSVKTKEGKPKPGFFERIQNVSGRFACLGLASTITAEVVTGKVLLTPHVWRMHVRNKASGGALSECTLTWQHCRTSLPWAHCMQLSFFINSHCYMKN